MVEGLERGGPRAGHYLEVVPGRMDFIKPFWVAGIGRGFLSLSIPLAGGA